MRNFLWRPKIKFLQTLAWWVIDLTLRGKHIVLDEFYATMMEYCIDEEKLDCQDGKKDPDIKKPDNFSHINWLAQEEMAYTYFTSMKNRRGLPLAYVICKTPSPSCIVIDREQEMIKNTPPQGNMFYCDTKKVLVILKELTVDTDSEKWIKRKCCGR